MLILSAQPTITAGAYSAGDAVGGVMTFNVGGGSRTVSIDRAEVLDDDASPDEAAMTLHLFTDSDLAVADNAAFSVTQAQYEASNKYIGSIALGASYAATPVGDNANATLAVTTNVDLRAPLLKGTIYGQLVADATPTFNATDQLVVRVHFEEYA